MTLFFVGDVIDRGLCGHCSEYSSYFNFESDEVNCEGCTHKTACSDLRSAYHYMISKALRMLAEDQTGKTVPSELEFPDS